MNKFLFISDFMLYFVMLLIVCIRAGVMCCYSIALNVVKIYSCSIIQQKSNILFVITDMLWCFH